MTRRITNTVLDLPFSINSRLRYHQLQLGIDEFSTRADVRARLDLIRRIRGVGPKSLVVIQEWLDEECPDAQKRRVVSGSLSG